MHRHENICYSVTTTYPCVQTFHPSGVSAAAKMMASPPPPTVCSTSFLPVGYFPSRGDRPPESSSSKKLLSTLFTNELSVFRPRQNKVFGIAHQDSVFLEMPGMFPGPTAAKECQQAVYAFVPGRGRESSLFQVSKMTVVTLIGMMMMRRMMMMMMMMMMKIR